jgi:hypothetical protein
MSHKGSFTFAKFIDENISDIRMPPWPNNKNRNSRIQG